MELAYNLAKGDELVYAFAYIWYNERHIVNDLCN